ncbi:MAG TPA: thioredoxin domain-containing protein [Kofleriaceae bacterium]|nr:thioredoxin domain-containing protein [Kofleriaceae bacterium]
MRPRLSLAALAFAVVGLGASIASLIDTFGASPTFCAEGCATVRESAWAHPLGIPMPVVGVVFFLAAVVLGFVEAPRLRRALAIGGAAGALFLIGVQAFAIGAWCKLCMVADPAALAYAILVLAGARAMKPTFARIVAAPAGLLATVGLLALWTGGGEPPAPAMPPGTPAFVEKAQAPDAATVVEVVDFECPYCRRMQERLTTALARVTSPIRVVRKMLPLAGHPHAMPAALAYCCADAQGKGEAMAAALFAAKPEDMTDEGCEKIAAEVGCDVERYRRDRPQAEVRVAAEMAEMRAAGIHALPTLFIGSERVVGAGKSTEELTAMLEQAVSAHRAVHASGR